MAGGVEGVAGVGLVDEIIGGLEEFHAHVELFNGLVHLVVLGDVAHEVVVTVGHELSGGDSAKEGSSESLHLFRFI